VVKPLPKILFDFPFGQVVCRGNSTAFLQIGTIVNSNYLYNWTSDDPTNITFIPNNVAVTTISVTTAASFGYHQIYLTVIDTSTGCSKTDTVCILIQRTPSVTIAPAGPFCEGTPVILTPTPNLPAYNYLWSNGVITALDTVRLPGSYSVRIDSMGCSSVSNFVFINPKPNLELFPRGCDTLCDTAHLYIPLANILGYPPPPGVYPSITWIIDGVNTVSGPYLYLNSISLGSHSIRVTVTNNFGCFDTSGIYYIYVKKCDSCPPCIKDSCCNLFLDSMKNKFIAANYVNSPIVVFTPPAGLLATDVVQWDFNCDGIIDQTTMGGATATYNYFTNGTYFACVKILRIIPSQHDTCYVHFTKKIVIEKKDPVDPCEFCQNLFVNINIKDDCAISGDRMRTAFATGGSGIYTYRWYNLAGVLQSTGTTYGGPSPCYCIVTDNVTGCRDTSGVDYYNDIVGCIPNTSSDARCTNFKLVIVKTDGFVTGDVILTAYGANGSGNYNFFWYGYAGSTGTPINSGGFVPGPTSVTTSALTVGPLFSFVKVRDLTWGCEAIDSFSMVDRRCKTASIHHIGSRSIHIYPIPSATAIYIESSGVLDLYQSTIRIIDLTGRLTIEQPWKGTDSNMKISLEPIPIGVYFLTITNRKSEIVHYQKISKE
jgi:hypothetical protein